MRRHVAAAAVAVAALMAGSVQTALALSGERWVPPDDTIVRVTGDAEEGFGIQHHDGTSVFPPTLSEALAECGEYDTKWARVRCRTQVRTWYRDLADIKDALRLARQTG